MCFWNSRLWVCSWTILYYQLPSSTRAAQLWLVIHIWISSLKRITCLKVDFLHPFCFSAAKSCLTLWTPWTAECQASLSLTISLSSPKFMSTESMMSSNHLILCHPLLLPLIFPSITVFSNESAVRIRWPTYWSFSISPSNEYSGLIFFRMDWFDLYAVQGTLKSLLQHHSSKASLTRSTFCGQVETSVGDLLSRKRVLSWVFPTAEIIMLLGKCSIRVDTCGKRPV